MNTIEDRQLIDDVQEGFRRHRSANRQLCKIHGILANQRRRKESLSVMLYLDIKNAFNAVNHSAIFQVLEAYAGPTASQQEILNCSVACTRNRFSS